MSVGRAARTYLALLCADTGRSLKDLPGAKDGRDGWKIRKVYGISVLSARLDDDAIYIYINRTVLFSP